jgi:NAD(P)-dependent dehydrogenase (short-subunit alcohol dehydrogenase family)
VRKEFESQIRAQQMHLHTVESEYTEFEFSRPSDMVILTQALFEPASLTTMASEAITDEVSVGLVDPMLITRSFLRAFPSVPGVRRNICFIGSTSAYAGFKNTSVYCAVKHGLLGFVRAMNDEYATTDDRFWLFSMGTMQTEMGGKVLGQDVSTYLQPRDVAQRIVSAIISPSNLFEPEVIIRRRAVKFL